MRKGIYSGTHGGGVHTVHAVDVEQVSNGGIAVRLRCCDDASSDHYHTLYALHGLDAQTIDAKLAAVAVQVAEQHASMAAAHEYLKTLTGDTPPSVPAKPSMKSLD